MTSMLPEMKETLDSPATREVDWEDFRDHLATADQQGNRRWIYPKKPAGRWYRRRTLFSWVLIAVMFGGPFVRINGNPLLMINIIERRFVILGQIFWPQDIFIFAVAMLVFLTGIIMFTTAFGRLWCGWTCPQTVMMEMVFRKLEYLIEGDAHQQRALDASPWTKGKIAKKLTKHLIFLVLSFVIGNTLLSYVIGSEQLLRIIRDNPFHHLTGLTFMILFTLIFYAIFARFREQACTFICPYGRLQSTMLDENTIVVAYDHKRGEKRAPLRREESRQQRLQHGLGDCVNCRQCVAVCPTGIDIRNGTQMECVNCTACIDACDAIMDRTRQPHGLIRFASLNNIERAEPQRFTTRMKVYTALLVALIAFFLFLLFSRSDVQTTVLRAPGALFQQTADGKIENIYTIKLVNKTSRDIPIELRLENVAGSLKLMGGLRLVVPKEQLAQTSILIELAPIVLTGPTTKLKVGVYAGGKRLETISTVFVGPRTGNAL
jgi:cytochrome c oxidase accessory protein FixG